MHPYYYEKLARQRHDELTAAADTHRRAREARSQLRLVMPRVERRALLAGRLRSIAGRLRPVRPGGYVGPVRWASQHPSFPADLAGPDTPRPTGGA